MAILTRQHKELFDQQGFLIAPFEIDAALIDQIIAQTTPHYQVDQRRGAVYAGQRIQDAWRSSSAVRQLALEPRVLQLLRELFGRQAFAFQTLNFQTGTEQRTHSDTIHFNSDPAGFMAGVWVALEDVDQGNGALKYYPGTHLWPEVTMQDVGVPPIAAHYPDYEQYISRQLEQAGMAAEYGVLKKGQLFIWHANLLHGGGPHPDKNRSRHSQVSHYFFEGCQYYTPMLSSTDTRHQRKPYRIRPDLPSGPLDRYDFLPPPARSWQQRLVSLLRRPMKPKA